MRLPLLFTPLIALAACGGTNADGNVVEQQPAVENVAAPQGQDWTEVVSKTPEGGYRMGNPDAPVKLVEYGSRTCPTCGRFAVEGTEPLKENYIATGRVSWEYRDLLLHSQDLGVALLGRCVADERYFPMLDQMFAAQPELLPRAQALPQATVAQIQSLPAKQAAARWVEELGYLDFVKQRGLSEARARECLNNDAMIEELAQITQRASQEGVSGTPTFFINGQQAQGAITWEGVEQRLQAAGAR